MFKAILILSAIACVRADFWIVQDNSRPASTGENNPWNVAVGANDYNCDKYVPGLKQGQWPSLWFTGLGPDWETMHVWPGLCGNTTGIDMYLVFGSNSWDAYTHGAPVAEFVGTCWTSTGNNLNCASDQDCKVAGGTDTGACEIAQSNYYCSVDIC